jgi:Fimbrial assembly protein (PilN)
MSDKTYIVLSVGPGGLLGCQLSGNGGSALQAGEWLERKWKSPTSQNLADRVDEMADFINELKGTDSNNAIGGYCLHPSWCLVKKISAPQAGTKETEQYLNLQVEREQSAMKSGELSWDYVQTPASDGNKIVLFMAKAATTHPIEEAMRASGVSPHTGSIISLGHLCAIKQAGELCGDNGQLAIVVEEDGASVLVSHKGELIDCCWIPISETSPNDPLGMSSIQLFEKIREADPYEVLLCGDAKPRERIASHLDTVSRTKQCDINLEKAVTDSSKLPARASALCGLALHMSGTQTHAVNLINHGRAVSMMAGRLKFLYNTKLMVPAAAVLLLLLFVVSVWTNSLETNIYQTAIDNSVETGRELSAASANLAVLQRYRKERSPLLDPILEISELLPTSITLTQFKIDTKGGVSLAGCTSSFANVEDLNSKLNGSKHFWNARTKDSQRSEKGSITFSIKCSLSKKLGGR